MSIFLIQPLSLFPFLSVLFYHRPIIFAASAVFLAGRFTALVVSRCGFRYQLVQIVDERGRSGRRFGYAEGLCQHH